jgi:hypothetical protein
VRSSFSTDSTTPPLHHSTTPPLRLPTSLRQPNPPSRQTIFTFANPLFEGKTAFTESLQGVFCGRHPPFSACILYPRWAVPFSNLWFNSSMNTKLSIENTETREQPVPAHSLWESQLVSKALGTPFEQLMRAHNIPAGDPKKKKPRPASKTAQKDPG